MISKKLIKKDYHNNLIYLEVINNFYHYKKKITLSIFIVNLLSKQLEQEI